jgi:hypothetical protein
MAQTPNPAADGRPACLPGLSRSLYAAGVTARMLVGTCSWTDKSLVDCDRFYPPEARTPEDRLRFYASVFPIVEVDSTYYGLPAERNAALWVERTPSDFTFDVKAFRLLTLHPTPAQALPKDVRSALPPPTSARLSLCPFTKAPAALCPTSSSRSFTGLPLKRSCWV